jgi:hypothetical protein
MIGLRALFVPNRYSIFGIFPEDSVPAGPVIGQGSMYGPGNQSGGGFDQSIGMAIFFDRCLGRSHKVLQGSYLQGSGIKDMAGKTFRRKISGHPLNWLLVGFGQEWLWGVLSRPNRVGHKVGRAAGMPCVAWAC